MKVRMLYGWSALSLRQMLPLLKEPTANGQHLMQRMLI